MPTLDFLIPFFVATGIFAFVPGVGMLYAVAQTVARGRQAGWWSAFGFHVAGLFHVAFAALGVSAILAIVPTLFIAMKLVGAVYLIWMGISYFGRPLSHSEVVGAAYNLKARKALRDSFVVEIFNPKSALFFLAFLPQFADTTAAFPPWIQIAVLGLVVNCMFTFSDGILIEASHFVTTTLKTSTRLIGILQKLGGVVLIGLGVKLALTESR